MQQVVTSDFKLGIIAGGQLGKMLAQAASPWDVTIHVLDPSEGCPAAPVCSSLTLGHWTDYDAVYDFGKQMDMVTLEIEHVNVDALRKLKEEGVVVHPDPEALAIIQDKGLQKEFYADNNIPTARFSLFENAEEVKSAVQDGSLTFPFVQKSRKAGYDGRGVMVIKNESDLDQLIDAPSMIEGLIDLEKEIAVIAARNEAGDVTCFQAVEMEFNEQANLVELLSCPAELNDDLEQQARQLAMRLIEQFSMAGVLAVEMFVTKQGELLVNEVAPRPHNSGHHTIESVVTSQYEQHLRAVLGFPLGSTELKRSAVMINLLGEPGHEGPVKYEGLHESMDVEGAKIHIYGKKETRPFRKMGHVTIIAPSIDEARHRAGIVKEHLKVKSWETQE
jgi:5-(carboxyamino)imidazole ribonucleotide synthase